MTESEGYIDMDFGSPAMPDEKADPAEDRYIRTNEEFEALFPTEECEEVAGGASEITRTDPESNPEKKHHFSKGIVVFSIVTILIFFTVTMYFTWHGRFVPDSVVNSFTRIFGIELGALAGIRIAEYISNRFGKY